MNFLELATLRRSVRSYRQKPVDRAHLETCIEAARISPSASNSQPWHYIVVENEDIRRRVAEATLLPPSNMNRFAASAPAIVVVVSERSRPHLAVARSIKRLDYALIDIGISAAHFCLQAAELGLGTCMIGWFSTRKLRAALGIPRSRRVALVITVGYPSDEIEPRGKVRKSRDKIVSYDGYAGA